MNFIELIRAGEAKIGSAPANSPTKSRRGRCARIATRSLPGESRHCRRIVGSLAANQTHANRRCPS